MNRSERSYALREAVRVGPSTLTHVPIEDWPTDLEPANGLIEVWRSKVYLVQVHTILKAPDCILWVAIRRVDGKDGITWDELQRLKHLIGLGNWPAVEYFPPDAEVINRANMRHLWVLGERPLWAWVPQPLDKQPPTR